MRLSAAVQTDSHAGVERAEVVTGADQDVGTETHRAPIGSDRVGARWVFLLGRLFRRYLNPDSLFRYALERLVDAYTPVRPSASIPVIAIGTRRASASPSPRSTLR